MVIEKKHYLIYQTTNLINNKIYIGKHITTNIEDNYFGSGKLLKEDIKKYGIENFSFKILINLHNEEEMNLLEKLVVTQDFCNREDTYNINVGGDGGWQWLNNNDYCAGSNKRKIAHEKVKQLYANNPELHKQFCKSISNGLKNKIAKMSDNERKQFRQQNSERAIKSGFSQAFKGKHHSQKTLLKIKQACNANPLVGQKNGMYGKRWIRNPLTKEHKLILNTDQIPIGWEYGKFQKITDKVIQQRKLFAKSTKDKKQIN